MMQSKTMVAAKAAVAPGSILIVDDEAAIRQGLTAVLARDGHQVAAASGVDEALQALERGAFEAAIVDIRMPGRSGIELLREIKERQPSTAVILLTGQGTLETAMAAIQAGAADYLLKPAQPALIRRTVNEALHAARRDQQQAKLLQTLRSGLNALDTLPAVGPSPSRPSGTAVSSNVQIIGELQINRPAHKVTVKDRDVPLTPAEYRVLLVLADRPGEVVDYLTLVRQALGYDAELWEAKELIKRHIFAMRQKLELDPARPRLILNVRAVGYRLAVE
jgi:DNA-binding response OmpR family regulator